MKAKMKSVFGLSAVLLAAQVMPAQAINKEWSAVAGFAGGMLVANAINCNRGYSSRQVGYQQPVVYHQPVQTVVVHQPQPQGYYQWQTQRSWVPGCWVYEDRGCGTTYKVWRPGYYQTYRTKVWVDAYAGW